MPNRTLSPPPDVFVAGAETIEHYQRELAARDVEVARLKKRQQELLATIVRVTNETPFPDEIKDWTGQRARLIAEVGTLKSVIAAQADQLAILHAEDRPVRTELRLAKARLALVERLLSDARQLSGGITCADEDDRICTIKVHYNNRPSEWLQVAWQRWEEAVDSALSAAQKENG